MKLTPIDLIFWAVTFAAHLFTFIVFNRSNARKRYPVFGLYLFFLIVCTSVEFITFRFGYKTYFYCYWFDAVLLSLMQVLLLFEIASHLMNPIGGDLRVFRKAALLGSLICALCAAILTLKYAAHFPANLNGAVITAQKVYTTAWCSVFLVCCGVSAWAGFAWDRTTLGIASGSAIRNCGGMLGASLYPFFHVLGLRTPDHIESIFLLLGTTVWILSMQREPERSSQRISSVEAAREQIVRSAPHLSPQGRLQ